MFDFECCLDTRDSPPVCYRHPVYDICGRKLINTHIKVLEDNDWIYDCVGPWGSLLLLGAKSNQEGCKDIKEFIWRLCVRCCSLNSVTRSVEFSIPCCTDSIGNFGDSNDHIYFISLDARSEYHQFRVLKSDQEQLAFFSPSGKNKLSR